MSCLNCNSEDSITVVFEENINCSECGTNNKVLYCFCNECGLIYKELNGQVVEGFILDATKASNIFNIDADFQEIDLSNKVDKAESMQDVVHKCIRCGNISYEKDENYYVCPNCGFEWEVMS